MECGKIDNLLLPDCAQGSVHQKVNRSGTGKLANLVERLDKASTAYGKEINAEKTKLMTNNTSGNNTEIKVIGQKLETVTSFEYLGSVITVPSQRSSPG